MAGFLRGSLLILTRQRETSAPESEWGTAVEQVVQDLEHLNRCTERDFLAVGEKLMEFRSTARRIASEMADLNELISGEHGRDASEVLAKVLQHSRKINARVEQSGQALGQVRDLSGRVRRAFDGLQARVSVFRVLCTLTRIETSRLGSTGADFGDLSAEVKPLSEIIQSSGEGLLEASSRLEQGVQSAIRSGSDLRVKQLKDLPALIAGVVNSLKAFEERRTRAIESSADQALQFGAVRDAMDDLVRSIQFHDITRQQIEHVVQAVRQLESEYASDRGHLNCLPPTGCALLTLQSSQLSGAARAFDSSIKDIERDLESIAVRVRKMAETSRELMGISADDQGSFFLEMEGHFTAILEMLSTSFTAQAGMESTAGRLEETIAEMARSIAEIRGVEIRIQRIATNATIQSAHIGAAGDALSVIAKVMHQLALDSNTNTEDVAGALEEMSEATSRVSGGPEHEASGVASDTDAITGEMRSAVVELHSSSESALSRVNQLAALGAQLAGDIGAVRGDFSVGVLFAQIVTRARDELERIGAQGAKESSEGADVAHAQLMASHAERYTMQTERDVHSSVVGAPAIEAAAPTDASVVIVVDDTNLGDNVELF